MLVKGSLSRQILADSLLGLGENGISILLQLLETDPNYRVRSACAAALGSFYEHTPVEHFSNLFVLISSGVLGAEQKRIFCLKIFPVSVFLTRCFPENFATITVE
jgi:hypothetical protein